MAQRLQTFTGLNLESLPKTHKDVFKPYNNPMGERMAVEFHNFLTK